MDETGLVWLLAAVFAPVMMGAATALAPREATGTRTLLALAGPLTSVAALLLFVSAHGLDAVSAGSAHLGVPLAPSAGIWLTFNPDALGVFFGLLIAGIGALIVLYARGYFGNDPANLARFYPTLGFFATAMMGVVLCDNMLAMLVFWELTSLSSFLLIGWDRENRKAVRLALQALATTGLGGLALMGGLILLGLASGQWTFSGLVEQMTGAGLPEGGQRYLPWALLLVFIGCATKSAQWPFHFWLPGAMAAPTPVSAYLHSATMVKAGVYLFARLLPALGVMWQWGPSLVVVGAITLLLGAWLALRSQELKKIFAYTTVSQLGLFVCAYGLGSWTYHGQANIVWPVTQILSHALYKAPLFMIAGAILHIAGRKELHQLRGLLRTHPLLAWVCLLAAYALAAGPFTLSFTAKEAFLVAIEHGAKESPWLWSIGAVAVLAAACNVAIFVRFLTTFLGQPLEQTREEHHAHAQHSPHGHETGLWGACLWWPAAALVLLQFVGGLWPSGFGAAVQTVETHATYWQRLPGLVHALTHPSAALWMSVLATALGAAVGLSRLWRTPTTDPHNRLFPACMAALEVNGWRIYTRIQSGNLRTYVYVIMAALLAGLVSAVYWSPGLLRLPATPHATAGPDVGVAVATICVGALVCITAVALTFVSSRIVRVLVLGTCGFSVTAMYLLYQAPDLALTQLMFELISVILFLLVLRMLPEEPRHMPGAQTGGRLLVSTAVGVCIGWLVLHVATGVDAAGPGRGLGHWFTDHAYLGDDSTGGRSAGAKNIVNAILVDFRGYDTLGEITVLAIAVMGVFSLVGGAPSNVTRARRARRSEATLPGPLSPAGCQPSLTTSLFRTSMRLILPLSLIFAGYMFFKGHDAPGGGFIAGLVASVSIAVYRMAKGRGALRRLLPLKPTSLAALGLAIALGVGLAPMLFGAPFLTSHNAHLPLAGGGDFHWASAMVFDLGVFAVVVAVSVGMINRLTEELE